jgi:hypothetical protein
MKQIRECLESQCICSLHHSIARNRQLQWRSLLKKNSQGTHSGVVSFGHDTHSLLFAPLLRIVTALRIVAARPTPVSRSASEREVIEVAESSGFSPGDIATKSELPQNIIEKPLTFAMMQLRKFLNPVLQEQR